MPTPVKPGQAQLRVLCNPGWRDGVAAAAAAEGESLSAYAREAIAARVEGRAAIASEDREELARAAAQLRIAGRNLNRWVMLAEMDRLGMAPPPGLFDGVEDMPRVLGALERAGATIAALLPGLIPNV